MSNVPFDRVLVPGPYGQQHLSFIGTAIPPQLGQFVAIYALTLLNMSYNTSNNGNGRRYLNNLLTFNNFNNMALNELVDLAFRLGWHMVVTRQRPALEHQSTVVTACEKALGVTVATLMVTNPVLIQDQPATQVDSIRKIAAAFQQERQTLARYTFQELNFTQNGSPVLTGLGAATSDGFVNTGGITSLSVSSEGSGVPGTSYDSEWEVKPSLSQASVGESPQTTSAEGEAPKTTSDDKVNFIQPPPKPVIKEVVQSVKVPDYKPRTYPKSIVTHNGVHEMDATTHARAYFGNMAVQAEQALINLRADSFGMATALSEPSGSLKRLTLEELKVEMTLENLLIAARKNHLRAGLVRDRTPVISRVLGVALNPTFSDRICEEKLHAVYQQDIRKIGDYLKGMVGSKDEKILTPEQHARLVVASYIDRTLGRTTNDFIARGLRLRASLVTFADSIGSAADFISTKCPEDYGPLFQSFLSNLSKNLRDFSSKETTAMVRQSLLEELGLLQEDEAKIGVVVVPIGHTVTFCNLTQTELEWLTKWNGSDIDPTVTPTLAEICFTLREDKRSFNFSSTYDWLMTGDGETFLVYENPDKRGGWRMFPVSGLNINRIDV